MAPCIVCEAPCRPSFTKDFGGLHGLGVVAYDTCPSCGCTSSRTHHEMSDGTWARLNEDYHGAYLHTGANDDDPRWLERIDEQHRALATLGRAGLLPAGAWLDWGCGDGRLADLVAADGVPIDRFDRYVDGPAHRREASLEPRSHPLVLTTSVLEHLRHRHELDAIEALVAPDGVFAFHTMVVEQVLPDPTWFYLLAVHTTFFTNLAMGRLLEQWGYGAAVYDVAARLWLACRRAGQAEAIAAELVAAGREAYADAGFVAYWRMDAEGRPYPMTARGTAPVR